MPAPAIVMYTSGWCPYCTWARTLLERKGLRWTEVNVEEDPERRADMIARSGARTVPQIFIDEHPIGGFDELHALDQAGELDALLGTAVS